MLKCKFNATQVMIIDTRQGSSVYVGFGQKQTFEQIPPQHNRSNSDLEETIYKLE